MQPTDEDGAPRGSGARDGGAGDARKVPSAGHEGAGAPSSDPTDPDAAMYAAMRARPDWTAKPAARAALQELSRDLESGEDPLFWEVARPGEIQVSEAREHASWAVPEGGAGARDGGPRTGLESRRLYLAAGAGGGDGDGDGARAEAEARSSRSLATVRRPGRNGPVADAALVVDATLVSRRAGSSSSRPPAAREAREARGEWRRGLPVVIAGVGVIAIGAAVGVKMTGPSRGVESESVVVAASARAAGSVAGAASAGMRGREELRGMAAPSVGGGEAVATTAATMTTATVAMAATAAAPSAAATGAAPVAMAPRGRGAGAAIDGKARLMASGAIPSSSPTGSATRIEVDSAPPVAFPSAAPEVPAATPAPTKGGSKLPESRPEF